MTKFVRPAGPAGAVVFLVDRRAGSRRPKGLAGRRLCGFEYLRGNHGVGIRSVRPFGTRKPSVWITFAERVEDDLLLEKRLQLGHVVEERVVAGEIGVVYTGQEEAEVVI